MVKVNRTSQHVIKDRKYISWEWESEKYICDLNDWEKILDYLDPNKKIETNKLSNHKTVRTFWHDGMWTYDETKKAIYCCEAWENERYTIFQLNNKEQDQQQEMLGFDAQRLVREDLYEKYGKKFQALWGAIENPDHIIAVHNINRCIGEFIGIDEFEVGKVLDHCYKADISSAYPSQTENLPDWHTAELVAGCAKPTSEWPFAFYLKSGHIAEFNRFDTHVDQYHFLYKNYKNPQNRKSKKGEPAARFAQINDEDEVTILCKYGSANLKEIYQHYYDIKSDKSSSEEEKTTAKFILNSSIGTFDYVIYDKEVNAYKVDKITYLGHLRAAIIARHNHKMIEIYNQLVRQKNEIIAVQVDSFIWRGKAFAQATNEKYLGAFVSEIENGKCFIHACGSYFIYDQNQTIEKHQGIKNFPVDQIKTMDDFINFFSTGKKICYNDFDEASGQVIKLEVVL